MKRGQASAPGIRSFNALIIWQPLQTPSAKVSVTAEEGRELVARARIEQDRPRPALAGTEHVAVGETAAGDGALEPGERNAAGKDVAHVHIDCGKAGAIKCCRHFDVAIDALLAQDGDLGTHSRG